ncbi:MAG: hypothetical protein M1420_00360 [Actinobacteria bacterium]|jgi:hypothetical protein|nr:hypothetical protein [Actinomycetota bacterium]
MGLIDKVKAQAGQAMVKAQQGMAQGQAKLDKIQAKRHADMLLRNLGAAVYAEQRQGGTNQAVLDALKAIDAFVSEQGPIDLVPGTPTVPGDAGTPTPGGSAAPSGQAGNPESDSTPDNA